MKTRLGLSVVTLSIGIGLASGACSSDSDGGGGTGGSAAGGTGGFGAVGAVSGTGGVGAGAGTGGAGATGGTGGSSDACAADENGAAAKVGCNGAAIGAQPDNAYGGKCTPDGNDGPGTCTDTSQFCDYFEVALGGICVIECTPTGGPYTSTGGCPTGSRCYDFGGVAFCYPDCSDGSGCGTGICDSDNACSSPIPPDPDGGTDGGTDGGASDAATD